MRKTSKVKVEYHVPDILLIITAFLISAFGVVMVFSSSYYNALNGKEHDAYAFLKDDFMWFVIAWVFFILFSLIDYHWIRKFAWPALGFGIVLLLLIFTPMGKTINNATRWLKLGSSFTIMPGEIIKASLILWTAHFLDHDSFTFVRKDKKTGLEKRTTFKGPARSIAALVPIAFAGLAFILIFKQPNLSTAGIVFVTVLGMMFIGGLPLWWIPVAIAGLGGVFFVAVKKHAYMLDRIKAGFHPFDYYLDEGWQVGQSLMALGSGGIWGKGLGKSIQKTLYLSESENDFILSIVGEELGFVGIVLLLFAYILLIWCCIRVALRAKDRFGMLFASGVGILFALQVMLNVAVISASFPTTGIFLPLVSYGGNGDLVFLSLLGIVTNISRQTNRRKDIPDFEIQENQ